MIMTFLFSGQAFSSIITHPEQLEQGTESAVKIY